MYNLKKKVSIIMATIKSKLRAVVHKDIELLHHYYYFQIAKIQMMMHNCSIHALKMTNKLSTFIKGTIYLFQICDP
jgi:hypothetical protein